MKTKIWFNRSFSTTYNFINLLRNNPDGREFEIYGTHHNKYSMILQACDHPSIEPHIDSEEYLDFALDFCQKNRIEVVVPGYKSFIRFSENRKLFEEIGCKLLLTAETEVLKELDNKERCYQAVAASGILAVPEHYIVHTPEEFKMAWEKLSANNHQVCFKPVQAEGGNGFHIIDDRLDTFSVLMGGLTQRITFADAFRAIETREEFPALMVSEFLDGKEYSLDCLADQGNLLACVPRRKIDSYLRKLEENAELVEISRKITEKFALSFAYNIQVRMKDDLPKLIEINPRMSGGLHYSCLSGINFPYLAVKLLLEGKIEVPQPKLEISIGGVEKDFEFKEIIED